MSKKRAFSLVLILGAVALILAGCSIQYDAAGNPVAPLWIRWLSEPIELAITFFNERILAPLGLASYGLAIILVTVLLKILLYPLTRKQIQSMQKMQAIQPQMKELQEKYGKDREKLAQKQMELYKESGVNPASGCLPLLLQMPILFAFYYALMGLGTKLDEPFLWIPSLAFPSYQAGLSWLTPLTPQHLLSPEVWPYLILPIIYVVSQLIMQRMGQTANPSVGGGSTNTVMMLMPLMFGYITLIVPSGLTLYWVTSNVLQIIQQGLMTGWGGLLPTRKSQPAPAAAGANKKVSGPVPASTGAVSSSVTPPTSEPLPVSAGRRRKLRKKKR